MTTTSEKTTSNVYEDIIHPDGTVEVVRDARVVVVGEDGTVGHLDHGVGLAQAVAKVIDRDKLRIQQAREQVEATLYRIVVEADSVMAAFKWATNKLYTPIHPCPQHLKAPPWKQGKRKKKR